MEFTKQRQKARHINMIPLINVVFLLLIFFMIAGTIERTELIPMELPIAENGKSLEEGPIEIVLGVNDEIVIADELLEMNQVQQRLDALLANNPKRFITIKADARIMSERVIKIMQRINQAGGVNVLLATQSM